MRAAFAILLAATGCDALFGLRPVPLDPDARHDADGNLDARRSDGSIDAPNKGGCASDGLTCTNVSLYQTTAGCYAACRDQIDYGSATSRCLAWGGALAIFPVDNDDTLLQQAMADTTTFWMGMIQGTNQTDPALGWSWRTGQPVVGARWYINATFGNQPDDGADKVENGEEQCGWYSTLGWGDGACATGFQFLCEK